MPLNIGPLTIDHPIFLAPMAGVTDHPFRVICRRYGVGVVYTEFVSSDGIVRESAKTLDMVRFTEDERPIGIQLFGDDARTIADSAAVMAERFRPDIIDLNFGCPVPKVVKKGAGSAMLRDLTLMQEVVRTTVEAVPHLPVTVKMRAGWDKTCIVATEAAEIIERVGAEAITLHPRTTKQSFTGTADWSLIKAIKERVSIPVIGNGDIYTAHDAMRMFEETGCDAVMVARGALGNPWIFSQIGALLKGREPAPVTLPLVAALCREHVALMERDRSERLLINYTKKHFGWYLKGFHGAVRWRKAFMGTTSVNEIKTLLDEFAEFAETHPDIIVKQDSAAKHAA